ncbi:ParB/RepB/Spo0J family partition protein [Cerasicoccus maritimus]|uniref:ParB/RepB/Spo0J family partition protein n=1 Tax=Cerasicoccus maritimus TaxID=490089 RepID=UPI0028524BA9|nr:ParB/RepB/Spo0J family partition protein [Cerasicoccus maritimus]
MITTKRFDYLGISKIQMHPTVVNHRNLTQSKVEHYAKDILANGLLEPLVVWEKSPGEFYLIGGFHRINAIYKIREQNPGYFDRVDVRVVAGSADEMRALNLKLNSDRVDTKITDYFETVVYLNNVNWSTERIGEFLDRSTAWVEEILRYAPVMPPKIYKMLSDGDTSWNRAKAACQKLIKAPAGEEDAAAAKAEQELKEKKPKKPLNFRSAKTRITDMAKASPKARYDLDNADLKSLILVLEGKEFSQADIKRVKAKFPGLV